GRVDAALEDGVGHSVVPCPWPLVLCIEGPGTRDEGQTMSVIARGEQEAGEPEHQREEDAGHQKALAPGDLRVIELLLLDLVGGQEVADQHAAHQVVEVMSARGDKVDGLYRLEEPVV